MTAGRLGVHVKNISIKSVGVIDTTPHPDSEGPVLLELVKLRIRDTQGALTS